MPTLVTTVSDLVVPSRNVPRLDGPDPPSSRRRLIGQTLPGTTLLIDRIVAHRVVTDLFGAVDRVSGLRVVVKILRPLPEEVDLRCFMEEIRLTRRIDSPRIVEIVASGFGADGSPWYAMTCAAETSLRDILRDGPLPLDQVVGLLRAAAFAVADVHSAGIVHRDVKPSNLLVDLRPGAVGAVLIDFGIACEIGVRPGHHSGTPLYMAPEQAEDAPATTAMDVFALGAVAYEMLAEGELRDVSTIAAVARAPPRRLPARNDRWPKELRRIVQRCLDANPARRYPTAGELGTALTDLQRACRSTG